METRFDRSYLLNPVYNYFRWLIMKIYLQAKFRGGRLRIGYGAHVRRSRFGKYNRVGRNNLLDRCVIGSYTYLADGVTMTDVTIGRFCSIGPNVRVAPGRHPTRLFVSTHPAFYEPVPECGKSFVSEQLFEGNLPVSIGNDVWIGANSVIIDGVKIGDGAVVAANTVVHRDVEPYSIVSGVPQRLIRKRFDDEMIENLQKICWWDKSEEWLSKNAGLFQNVADLIKLVMNRCALISVIIVVYNRVTDLQNTLDSFFSQDFSDSELIIIDGGSNDGTAELIEKYSDRLAFHCSEPDHGVYDAMNKGTRHARGQWVYFLGAGDILENSLTQVARQLDNPNTIYYGDVFHRDIHRLYDGKFNGFKLAVNNLCHQSVFYPAAVFKKYQFNTSYKVLADHELNMRCYGDKAFQFKYLPIRICDYQGGGLSSATIDPDFYRDKLRVIRNNFSIPVFIYAAGRRMLAKLLK